MNTQLKIEPKVPYSLRETGKDFPFSLSSLLIWQPEPLCPFCGKELKFARCSCSRFSDNLQSLLSSFGGGTSLQVNGITLNQEDFSPKEQLIVEERPATDTNLGLFVNSTVFKLRNFWEASLAEYCSERNTLMFHLRKIGDDKIFHCTLLDFNFVSETAPRVRIVREKQILVPGRSRRFGDYSFVREVTKLAEFSYEGFLNKIKGTSSCTR